MKKASQILLVAVFFILINAGSYAGTVDPPYEVGTWQGFRTAAVSFTFDDNLTNQFAVAMPMLDAVGFNATFYIVTGSGWYYPADWPTLQTAAANGHEIGCHTVTHTDLSGMSSSEQHYECSTSQDTINSYIEPNQCYTIAYPYCNSGTESIMDDYFIAGRTCAGQVVPSTPTNFFQISSIICGNQGVYGLKDLKVKLSDACDTSGWCVLLFHAIDDDNGYSPLPSTRLFNWIAYIHEDSDTYWVETFLNVVRYIKERDDVSVSELSSTDRTITLQVTDTLYDVIYNYPVTIRRPVPAGWPGAHATQNGQPVPSSMVQVESTSYVMFDVVPDGGEVVLIKALPAPEGLESMETDANKVSLDWDDNSESYLAGYHVYRSTTYKEGYSKINSSLLSSSDYNDVNVPLDTTYYYVVTAEDINSFESDYSNQAVVFGGLYGDFVADDVIDLNDLAIFLNYWPVNDCNETAGVDIDDNCTVNFCEFAGLAEHWF